MGKGNGSAEYLKHRQRKSRISTSASFKLSEKFEREKKKDRIILVDHQNKRKDSAVQYYKSHFVHLLDQCLSVKYLLMSFVLIVVCDCVCNILNRSIICRSK